ncbi:MAG: cupin domain-containing protein [Chloroflexi bacterium]|nr:cupin domain-containing protein [Chloroflexota bacterium]
MPKPEREFFPVSDVDWTPAMGGQVPGLTERILATDPATGFVTRLLRFAPGTNTSSAGVQVHECWEEVYILEGSLHDLTLDQTFGTATFACRPPGMRHGPWIAPNGCTTFEVRYAARP